MLLFPAHQTDHLNFLLRNLFEDPCSDFSTDTLPIGRKRRMVERIVRGRMVAIEEENGLSSGVIDLEGCSGLE